MIILRIQATSVNAVMDAGFDNIRIYRDISSGGTFTNLIASIPIIRNQTQYEYTDVDGDNTSWYEFSYFRSTDLAETQKTSPLQGIPGNGPLNILTPGYVVANTDFPELANLPTSKISELIIRAESLIQRYADQYGGLDTLKQDFGTLMPIAARMLVENLWLFFNPRARKTRANGFTSERIGSYAYTRSSQTVLDQGNPFTLFTEEALNIINWFLLGSRVRVSMKTTQVFPELKPLPGDPLTPEELGVEIRPWHDFTDLELAWPLGVFGINNNRPSVK